jgi:hypothetical protein
LSGVRIHLRQLPEHVRNVGVLRVGPPWRTIRGSGIHRPEPARLVVRVIPKTCPSLLDS